MKEPIHSAESILSWLHVWVPKKPGPSRWMWRFVLPSALRKVLEEAAEWHFQQEKGPEYHLVGHE